MTALALPTSATAGAVYLVIIGALALAAWLVERRIWPWARCPRCRGTGRLPSPVSRGWRDCPRCSRSGRRPRRL
ncbi:MAG TPA: hypothetical protein VJT31_36590, partial [Rugosimonospora sp.]|nr:hypothetical protein [Rugosimonospora sp.]